MNRYCFIMTLNEFFKQNNKVALAFSGGVDSAYLLYEAKKSGADVKAYYVKSQFQPQFELEDALRLAEKLKTSMEVIEVDVLSSDEITSNPSNRCYFCKRKIFGTILEHAKKDGYKVILDGTNASDDETDRPGTVALREYEVKSPLRECGLTKDRIRQLSKEAGLFTFNKPAYACLATRIRTGEVISSEKLAKTEKSEEYLKSLGFEDFRVRMKGNDSLIQLRQEDFDRFYEHKDIISVKLKEEYGYDEVSLDINPRG